MNARDRKKLERSLKILEREGLVFPRIPDYAKQKRVVTRILRTRVKRLDSSANLFLKSHFDRQNRHFDSEQAREFFGRIMQARGGLTQKINVLRGDGKKESEYDSP